MFGIQTSEGGLTVILTTRGHKHLKIRDQSGAELVITLIPTDIFVNKISETFRDMVQSCLINV